MISSDVINAKIDLVEQNNRLLEELKEQGYESFSQNFRDIQAAKHSLQESIEACLDISNHIIAEKGFRRGEDYKDIFSVIEEEGIIDAGLSARLQEMAQFRNLLVHQYGRIDTRRLFIIMSEDLKDIEEFIKSILTYIP
ncbi:MAG: DUF86 domain-containing protein [Methanosarcinales archaeon]|nr:DUF86 domain-containing protein [Methanosarcinales archaeon]